MRAERVFTNERGEWVESDVLNRSGMYEVLTIFKTEELQRIGPTYIAIDRNNIGYFLIQVNRDLLTQSLPILQKKFPQNKFICSVREFNERSLYETIEIKIIDKVRLKALSIKDYKPEFMAYYYSRYLEQNVEDIKIRPHPFF